MVGKAIAIDLSKKHEVWAADIDQRSLDFLSANYPIKTVGVNLMEDESIESLVADFDLVVSAVPGFMGFDIVQTVIEAGKNIVDISFMPEDFMELNNLAARKGVTAITDCGVAPGIPNLIAGHHNEYMEIEDFTYHVGGLPKVKVYPFYYKAPFSPIDVVEEYTRPARFIEKGKHMTKPAMSEPEMVFFDKVGTLEAFLYRRAAFVAAQHGPHPQHARKNTAIPRSHPAYPGAEKGRFLRYGTHRGQQHLHQADRFHQQHPYSRLAVGTR